MNRVSFSTSGLSEGTHTIIAKYAGQGGFSSSGDAITVHVGVVGTTTTVEANSTSTVYGQSVLLTAHIGASGQGTPTGSVQFWDAATSLGTSAVATVQTAARRR